MTDPEQLRTTVLATPGVVAMHPGPYGTASAFCATGRIWGVRIAPQRLDLHIVAAAGVPLDVLGRSVREATRALAGDREIVVHIEDLAEPAAVEGQSSEDVHPEEPRRIP